MRPLLTVGTPVHEDTLGLWSTIMALRLMHKEIMYETEILVVDQSPGTSHGNTARDFMTWVKGDVHSARYIPYTEIPGSAPAKEKVFKEAQGEVVVCVDSHVLFWENSLEKLLEYFGWHSSSKDLLAGPMVYDNLSGCATHLENMWRTEQWGTWAEAKRCKCGVAVEISIQQGKLVFREPDYKHGYSSECPKCGNKPQPSRGISLDDALLEAGFTSMIQDSGDPFEIWAHGTGLLACRKEAWPGFAPGMRGFGAEEVLIHEKFRKGGAKVLCAPWLKWVHRFLRPDGPKYSLTRFDKVRNFVLGFKDVGFDLEPVYEHFVKSGLLPKEQWQAILDGASSLPNANPPGCGSCGQPGKMAFQTYMETLATWYTHAVLTPHDINEHVPALRELASKCKHVTEFGARHGISTVALLVGAKEKLVSYFQYKYPEAEFLEKLSDKLMFKVGTSLSTEIEETECLFIDTIHTARQLYAELTKHHTKVSRYIVLHDTQIFGEKGEDGGPGLLVALRQFMREHPEWIVKSHTNINNGLTIISRDPEDKKPLPSGIKMAWNFSLALAKHVAAGGTVSEDQLKKRLDICSFCEQRSGENCAVCGCPVLKKASWDTEACPIGKWAAEGV